MRSDGMNNRWRSSKPPCDIGSNECMRPLDFMVHSLTDIMEQRRGLGDTNIRAQLGGHMRGQQCAFERMVEDILPVAGAIFQPTEELNQIGVETLHIRLISDAL